MRGGRWLGWAVAYNTISQTVIAKNREGGAGYVHTDLLLRKVNKMETAKFQRFKKIKLGKFKFYKSDF